MKIKIYSLILLSHFLLLSSCIDEYWPDIKKYDNLLVIDGVITNGSAPYTISLSVSTDINAPRHIPYENCEVSIIDDLYNEVDLIEEEPGKYKTQGEELVGQPSRQYKLTINTPDGKTYESSFETLKAPVEIDTIYNLIEYHESSTEDHDLAGYQFYIDTKTAEYDSAYFWWSLEETYEYNADFTIEYTYSGSIKPFTNWDTLYTCWRTLKVNKIFITNTENLAESRVLNFPLNYVDTETRRLSVRYSLLINQYTIDAKVYEYWNNIKTQIEESGSLYSTQPFQVRGNMVNVDDPEEPVLGYFIAAGLSQKRIFPDPPAGVLFYYSTCLPVFDMGLGFTRPWHWPIYITLINGTFATASEGCFDCTSKGGTTEMPEFWHYN